MCHITASLLLLLGFYVSLEELVVLYLQSLQQKNLQGKAVLNPA